MSDSEPHLQGVSRIDWKAVIAMLALTWTVLLGVAGVFRSHLLDSIDVRIAEHQAEAAESRRQFFSELEQRSAGSLGRIGQLEINCARFQDWRSHIDRDLEGLRSWRDSASQRLEQCTSWITVDDRRMDTLERHVEALKDRLRGSQALPGERR